MLFPRPQKPHSESRPRKRFSRKDPGEQRVRRCGFVPVTLKNTCPLSKMKLRNVQFLRIRAPRNQENGLK